MVHPMVSTPSIKIGPSGMLEEPLLSHAFNKAINSKEHQPTENPRMV